MTWYLLDPRAPRGPSPSNLLAVTFVRLEGQRVVGLGEQGVGAGAAGRQKAEVLGVGFRRGAKETTAAPVPVAQVGGLVQQLLLHLPLLLHPHLEAFHLFAATVLLILLLLLILVFIVLGLR